MNLLLTNDDGIDAPGIMALFEAVKQSLGESINVIVVAPDRGRSECGHSVTTGRPLVVQEIRPGWFSVDGTPVDCVRAATSTLVPEVHAVISGINAGANLGIDLLVSGTFAAAREAAFQGIPALAVSHYRRPDVPKTWEHVESWLAATLAEFVQASRSRKTDRDPPLWNVNLPAINPNGIVPPRVECGVDTRPMVRQGIIEPIANQQAKQLSMSSEFHGRPREDGSDVDQCFAGKITLSRLTTQIV